MKVPFVDLKADNSPLKNEIMSEFEKVFDIGAFSSGSFVEKFENSFAGYNGVKHCVAVNSGTSALHLALLAAGVLPGDEVITTPHTFISTTWAITYCGAKPVFVDINNDNFGINPHQIESKITEKTKAILPVHIYGNPCNISEIKKIADKHGIALIEDAAQAQGAEQDSQKCGTFGIAGCFSFYPAKNLGALGEGGAIITNNDDYADELRNLRNHAQKQKNIHDKIGFNYRMDGFQGAALNIKLRYLDLMNQKRIDAANYYNEAFSKYNIFKIPVPTQNSKHIYHLYELNVPFEKRNDLLEYLHNNQIGAGLHYLKPVHLQPAYSFLDHKEGDFPISEKAMNSNISLPIFPEISREQQDCVIEKVVEFFQ